MLSLRNFFKPLVKDEKGQTMIEYALMVVLIALAVVLIFPTVASTIRNVFSSVNTQLS